MNSEEILQRLFDIFYRGSPLANDSAFKLSLQILAYAKLSVDEKLPLHLRFSKDSKPSTSEALVDCFNELSKLSELGEDKAAFENMASIVNAVPAKALSDALDVALDIAQRKLLDIFDIYEELCVSMSLSGVTFMPQEVIEVMSFLAGSLEGKTVYCPYDTFSLIAHHVREKGGTPVVETPWRSPFPLLTNILTSSDVHAVFSDPLQQPSFVNGGQLQKFDNSIVFPPFGAKVDIRVSKENLFKRFEEETSSISVLVLRHVIAQTKERAVIALPSSILFGRGSKHTLRRSLLSSEIIEAVISMPPALLPFIPIPFSILVLNVQDKSSTVRFVNGAEERFFAKAGRNRNKLVNWEALIETIQKHDNPTLTVDVSTDQILRNDANLEVSQYLLSPEQKAIKELLEESETRNLEELVTFLRPSKLPSQGESGEISALEVSASDFPDYGYLRRVPKRQVLLPKSALNSDEEQSFLRSGDIVIAMKGSAGKVTIIPDGVPPPVPDGWVANQSCLIMRPKKDFDSRVLFMYLRSEIGQALLASLVSEATVPLIQLKQLRGMKVVTPNVEEFAIVIRTFEEQVQTQAVIDSLKEKLEKLNEVHWTLSQ